MATEFTELYQSEPPRYQGLDYGPTRKMLVGIDSLAWCFEVDSSTVRRWSANGIMPKPIKVGTRTLWKADEIREWMKQDCPRCETKSNRPDQTNEGGRV